MHTLFEGKPGMQTVVKIGIIAFLGLSIISLYYRIKTDRKALQKEETL